MLLILNRLYLTAAKAERIIRGVLHMKEKRYKHRSRTDGLLISVLRMEPDDPKKIKGIVQLVHGMNEYKERYIPFMEYLAENGYIAVIHDNRGHGESVESAEDLGFMYRGGYRGLIRDTYEITKSIKVYAGNLTGRSDLPFTLLGHSMGSLIVRCYLREYDNELEKLCVLGSPSGKKGMKEGLALIKSLEKRKGPRARVGLIAGLVMGGYEKRFTKEGVDHSWINSDLDAVRAYNEDPLCNYNFTLNGYRNLVELTRLTYEDGGYVLNNPALPIRFFSGADDPCAVSLKAYKSAIGHLKKQGYENVDGRWYMGMRHEILNEPKHKKVYEDILAFIES